MKTNRLLIILCAAFFLALPLCTAELDVKVSSYNSTSQLAKIEVVNTNTKGYSKIILTIDNRPPVFVTESLKPNNSALIPQIIDPGVHDIVLTTKEGVTVKKSLYFLKNEDQLAAEVENSERLWKLRQEKLGKLAQETNEELDKLIKEEKEKKEEVEDVRAQVEGAGKEPVPEKTRLTKYLLISLGILALIIVLFIFWFKRRGFGTSNLKSTIKKESLNKEEIR